MAAILIDPIVLSYLKTQIESNDAIKAKSALQNLCKLHRSGQRVAPSNHYPIEHSINGILSTHSSDEKIRRWALNAIARFGHEIYSKESVVSILKRYKDDPQTSASAIAALFALNRKDAGQILNKLNLFPQDLIVLAALQHVPLSEIDISNTRINVDSASSDILKLALVIVGLNRAPENIFDPRHPNSTLVKILGGHHDPIVSQYSVWAITENDNLGVRDLGIDLPTIERQPTNVRSWILRLIAMDRTAAEGHLEYLRLGSEDQNSEARLGLAAGLRNTYFDGIDELTSDWFFSEDEEEVRSALLDHFICNAEKCPTYNKLPIEIYTKEQQNSLLRQRMEATAAGTKLYREFKKISYTADQDLFSEQKKVPLIINHTEINVSNKTYNIQGGIQAGAVSFEGNATNSGTVNTHYNPQKIDALRAELLKAQREIESAPIDKRLKDEALSVLSAAHANPNPSLLTSSIAAIKKVASVAASAPLTGAANLIAIADVILKLMS